MPSVLFASCVRLLHRFSLAFLERLSSPTVSLVICYLAGLLATHSIEADAQGAPLTGLAAAAVAGLVIRYGRGFGLDDALLLVAARLAFAAVFGEGAVVMAVGLAVDLLTIWCAALLFGALRRKGFVSSQARVVAALGAVAAAAGALQAAPALALAIFGGLTAADCVAVFVTASLGAMLILTVSLAFDRADRRIDAGAEEKVAVPGETLAASALLAALTVAAILDGRQEIALGASAALMWFATRLGLFATALGALMLVSGLLAFGAGADWRALQSVDPAESGVLRAVALTLLTVPSLIVAAITHDHRSACRDLAFRAFHDGLTTLANRARFLDVLTSATDAARAKGRRFAVFLVDLDHFKSVNDSFGHAYGDALLVEVSRRLRDTVRATDMVARLGGDEFAVIAPVPTSDDAARLAQRLVNNVDRPFVQNGLELQPSITVGVALAPDSTVVAERLMALADHALYEAKAAGRNCWRICASEAEDAFAADWTAGHNREPKAQIVYLD